MSYIVVIRVTIDMVLYIIFLLLHYDAWQRNCQVHTRLPLRCSGIRLIKPQNFLNIELQYLMASYFEKLPFAKFFDEYKLWRAPNSLDGSHARARSTCRSANVSYMLQKRFPLLNCPLVLLMLASAYHQSRWSWQSRTFHRSNPWSSHPPSKM